MDASTAKTEQSTAKRLFTMARNQLMKSITDSASIGAVQSKFQSLSNRMEEVMNKHATYLAYSHPDEAEPTDDEKRWLQEIEDLFTEAERSYESYTSEQKTQIHAESTLGDKAILTAIKKKTRLCRFEMDSVESMLSALNITVEDETASIQSIKDAQSELKCQMDNFRSIQRELIAILEDDKEVDLLSENMQKLQKECAKLNITAGAGRILSFKNGARHTAPTTPRTATHHRLDRIRFRRRREFNTGHARTEHTCFCQESL